MKMFGIIAFLILIVSGMPLNTNAEEQESGEPIIEIDVYPYPLFEICITNTGDDHATCVIWSIVYDGGWMLFERFGARSIVDGTPLIPPDFWIIITPIRFGIGRVIITISAECNEGSSDELVIETIMCGFFLIN